MSNQTSTQPLSGKVAIVTGGSRGIGLATASRLLARGASVVISGLDDARLDEARRSLAGAAGAPPRLLALRADVQDRADVERMVAAAVERFGGLDVLVNNAGVGSFSAVAETTDEQWHRIIGTNLTGVFYACRAVIPPMRARGGGWIINVSSLAGKNAFTGGGAYCASKAALNAFSEVLMQEVRHDGIRVSYVMPGSVSTEFSPGGSSGADWKLAADDVAQVIVDLLAHPPRSLPSRVELRPSMPPKK
jgi:NAD(P)-dependent dehydrogenase (short-subunit alcohol dehydrogenase family)